MLNAIKWLWRSGYRMYLHPPAAIYAAASAGLLLTLRRSAWPWKIVAFEHGGVELKQR